MDDGREASTPGASAEPERLGARAGHVGRGFLMGTADVIPGVSGGTIALILGIYPRLVRAIRNVDASLAAASWAAVVKGAEGRSRLAAAWRRADLTFLLVLALGILAAVIVMAGAMTRLLDARPLMMLALFFGLILAGAWIPWRMIVWREWGAQGRIGLVALMALGAAAAYVVSGLDAFNAPQGLWFVPVAGAIAICAMILPGISGAFLLVVLGMYERLLVAVHARDVALLALFTAGAAVGLLAFSRLLSFLLGRARDRTLAVLTGFMLGALRKLWPFKASYDAEFGTGQNVLPDAWGAPVWVALAAFSVGVVIVVLIDRLARQRVETEQGQEIRP